MSFLRDIYNNFEEYVCVTLVGAMTLCLCLQVVIRIFMGSSLAFTEELSRYCFIWTVYVGAALAAKHGGHVRITAQFALLPKGGRLLFRIIGDLVWIAFNIFVAFEGIEVLKEAFEYPETSPTLGITKAWIECILPASFIMVSWRIIEQYIVHFRQGTLDELTRIEGDA